MTTISSHIAGWVNRTSLSALPPEVVQGTKLRILDLTGVMLASSRLGIVQAARRAWAEIESGAGATQLGTTAATSPATAAFLNGIAASALEFDDTYLPTTIHATGLALSVCYPEAQRRPVSGAKLIESVLLASESMIRLSVVSTQDWFRFGIHPTGAFGVFGGVCALAKLRGLDDAAIIRGLGHAGSMSAALTAAFEDGTSTKNLHVGLAAANAFRAVALAQQDISGPTLVYEGKFGWYRAHVQSDGKRHYEAVTTDLTKGGLEQDWLSLEIATKLYPVAYPLMPHIEAAIELRNQYGIEPEEVDEIDAYLAERTFPMLCEPPELKMKPLTTWHGRISVQHTIAEALVRGEMTKNAYSEEAIRDPRINLLATKVRHLPDLEAPKNPLRSRAKIVVRMKDGRELSHEILDFRGTRRNPMTTDDYIAKFRANTGDLLPAGLIDETIDSFLKIEGIDDIVPLLQRLTIAA
ncbi:MmgE/PrpD family protein [Bosea caraganae]|uniref:MmgE/PrpD family protein n=1 Tax=Bosea caraganae TaxID=2763117 RepID=UPI0015F0904A|nr:MmgE/PrpD family protein [Bosea caraganae]